MPCGTEELFLLGLGMHLSGGAWIKENLLAENACGSLAGEVGALLPKASGWKLDARGCCGVLVLLF